MTTQCGVTMADPSPKSDDSPFPFMDLKPEIRLMVLKFAYGEEDTVKLISRAEFEARCWLAKRRNATFPESPLCAMLVSKQFLDEAACVWLSAKTFEMQTSLSLVMGCQSMKPAEAYLFVSMRSVKMSLSRTFSMLSRINLPRLARLSIYLDLDCFEGPSVWKDPLTDDYTDAEIAQCTAIKSLFEFRGISELNILWENIPSTVGTEASQKYHRFKNQASALITDVMVRPVEQRMDVVVDATLQDALDRGTALARQKGPAHPATLSEVEQNGCSALADDDVPDKEDELVRKILTQPMAMCKWIAEVKQMKRELNEMVSLPFP